jgi:hypothetical protein
MVLFLGNGIIGKKPVFSKKIQRKNQKAYSILLELLGLPGAK